MESSNGSSQKVGSGKNHKIEIEDNTLLDTPDLYNDDFSVDHPDHPTWRESESSALEDTVDEDDGPPVYVRLTETDLERLTFDNDSDDDGPPRYDPNYMINEKSNTNDDQKRNKTKNGTASKTRSINNTNILDSLDFTNDEFGNDLHIETVDDDYDDEDDDDDDDDDVPRTRGRSRSVMNANDLYHDADKNTKGNTGNSSSSNNKGIYTMSQEDILALMATNAALGLGGGGGGEQPTGAYIERTGPLQYREIDLLQKGLQEAFKTQPIHKQKEEKEDLLEAEEEKKYRMTITDMQPILEKRITLLILGDSGVGKSSVLQYWLYGDTSNSEYITSTPGINVKNKCINMVTDRVNIQIWDTSGLEKYHKLTTAYYKRAHGIICIYDVSNKKSLENIHYWIKTIKANASSKIQILLIGNKTDLRDNAKEMTYSVKLSKHNSYHDSNSEKILPTIHEISANNIQENMNEDSKLNDTDTDAIDRLITTTELKTSPNISSSTTATAISTTSQQDGNLTSETSSPLVKDEFTTTTATTITTTTATVTTTPSVTNLDKDDDIIPINTSSIKNADNQSESDTTKESTQNHESITTADLNTMTSNATTNNMTNNDATTVTTDNAIKNKVTTPRAGGTGGGGGSILDDIHGTTSSSRESTPRSNRSYTLPSNFMMPIFPLSYSPSNTENSPNNSTNANINTQGNTSNIAVNNSSNSSSSGTAASSSITSRVPKLFKPSSALESVLTARSTTSSTGPSYIETNVGQQLAKKYRISFFECSAKSGTNIDEALLAFISDILEAQNEATRAAQQSNNTNTQPKTGNKIHQISNKIFQLDKNSTNSSSSSASNTTIFSPRSSLTLNPFSSSFSMLNSSNTNNNSNSNNKDDNIIRQRSFSLGSRLSVPAMDRRPSFLQGQESNNQSCILS